MLKGFGYSKKELLLKTLFAFMEKIIFRHKMMNEIPHP